MLIGLKKHILPNRHIVVDDLPSRTVIGRCYLVKNNSIIEFNSMFSSESMDIRFDVQKILYKTVITIHKLDLNDVGGIANADIFTGMDEMTSYSSEKTTSFMLSILHFEFDLYY